MNRFFVLFIALILTLSAGAFMGKAFAESDILAKADCNNCISKMQAGSDQQNLQCDKCKDHCISCTKVCVEHCKNNCTNCADCCDNPESGCVKKQTKTDVKVNTEIKVFKSCCDKHK